MAKKKLAWRKKFCLKQKQVALWINVLSYIKHMQLPIVHIKKEVRIVYYKVEKITLFGEKENFKCYVLLMSTDEYSWGVIYILSIPLLGVERSTSKTVCVSSRQSRKCVTLLKLIMDFKFKKTKLFKHIFSDIFWKEL